MTTSNISTRAAADKMEKRVCRTVNGLQSSNSGAGNFQKADVFNKAASLSCECKCSMSNKESISLHKNWIDKHKQESNSMLMYNTCLAVDFGPDSDIYYVIDTKLMKYLVSKLEEENGVI